jgi:hypothetical protein
MKLFQCNIDKTDRINRIVLGVLILIGLILGVGKLFFTVLALVLIVEGLIGWCSIPLIISKLKAFKIFK